MTRGYHVARWVHGRYICPHSRPTATALAGHKLEPLPLVDCVHWSACDVRGGGCCARGLYGGHPSLGTCAACLGAHPDIQPANIFARAAAWARAEASVVLVGELSDADFGARVAVCAACPALQPAPAPAIGFCGACGCGTSARAELTIKGRMPLATCPHGKWP